MKLTDLYKKATSEVAEPAQTVLNAALIGGVVAGLLVGGSYLYKRFKGKRNDSPELDK